ncbi:MAG: hypothetical protein PHW92_07720 [Lutibacter sp.]|nr:hypothetical protein [Lutibacter sp.]
MKKIILSMVFVFASLTFINANGVNIVKNSGCVEDAFALQTFLEVEAYDMEFANDVAADWYDACVYVTR